MTTDTTANLTKQLIGLALDTANAAGTTARSLIGARAYINRPPDNATYPFAVARLYNYRTDPSFDNTRCTATLELVVFARPRTTAQTAEQIADVLCQAFARMRVATSGILSCNGVTRDTLPEFHEPADSDVTAIRVTAALIVWPILLLGG